MSPERDEPTEEQEPELYEDVPPRSIFAATWFRVVLVVIVLGVIGAVAVPYVLDWMSPPPPRSAAVRSPLAPAPPTPSVFDKPAGDRTVAEKPAEEKSVPVPVPAPVPARPEARTEPAPAPAEPAKPADEPTTAAKATPPARPSTAEAKSKPAASAKPEAATAAARSEAKPATASKPGGTKPAVARATPPAASGPYWVQVGAFKDPEAAKRLATKLRGENFTVEESVTPGAAAAAAPKVAPTAPSGADHYDVYVTGTSLEDLNKRLAGRGLTADASGSGGVVKPSLPLRDAVSLSKELAVDGLKVQVRRAGNAPAAAAPAPAAAAAEGATLHRVRVGAFPDRAAAQAAARELQSKGYKPFIARGDR